MGGGGGGGSGGAIGWVGYGKGLVGAYIARRRTRKLVLDALEADMTERGLPLPPRPMSREKIFGIGFLCGAIPRLAHRADILGTDLIGQRASYGDGNRWVTALTAH